MKKINYFLLTLSTGVMLVACTSTDALIDKYEQACKEGNLQKATEIAQKLEKKELTTEQNLRIVNASFQLGAKTTSDVFDGIMDTTEEIMKGALEKAEEMEDMYESSTPSCSNNKWDRVLDNYEECVTKYAKLVERDKAGEDVDDALDRIEDKIDNLFEELDKAEKAGTKLSAAQSKRFTAIFDRWYDIDN